MAQVRAGTLALVFVSLPVLLGAIVYGPFILDILLHRRPPSRFLIPSGYQGWVRVEYRVPNAPPLPREGKYLLVRLANDGTLKTSSDLPEGWGHDQFFYVLGDERTTLSNAGWCKGGMIWDEVTGKNEHSTLFLKFFRRYPRPVPDGKGPSREDVQPLRIATDKLLVCPWTTLNPVIPTVETGRAKRAGFGSGGTLRFTSALGSLHLKSL